MAAYLIDQDHHYVPVFYLKQWAESDGRVYGRARPAFVERVFKAQKAHLAAIAG
jgi:hypothetical protein